MVKDKFSKYINYLLSDDEWLIVQKEYKPEENLKYESIFCLTNGYMGTRGCHEEGNQVSLPCTYINGVFDKSETFMRELANIPNWLGIKLYVDKQLIGVDSCKILEYVRALDMKKSLLVKKIKLSDKYGRETLIEGIRYLNRNDVHLGCIKLYVTPLNYEGILEVENIIDASVINFRDAPRFKVKHINLIENTTINSEGEYVEVKTRDFGMHIGVGCKLKLFNVKGEEVAKNRKFNAFGETAIEFLDCDINQNNTVQIHKLTSIYNEREVDRHNIKTKIISDLEQLDFNKLDKELEKHIDIYNKKWEQADIKINGDDKLNKAIRFNIYHLMSTASETDDRINIGAKLLHGEEYGGHAFWDTELFMLPFFSFIFPKTASNLVKYRFHLIEAARNNAKDNGFKGAKYPWESADTGEEECPDFTILSDGSCYRCYVAKYEHHVTADIAYGAFKYFTITNDYDYLLNQGAEIILETARFWVSRFEYNKKTDLYEINNVTGPDEWHEPVNNNFYTNYLAKWNIETAIHIYNILMVDYPQDLKRIRDTISLKDNEIATWKLIVRDVYLPIKKNSKLFEQFDGYFNLLDSPIVKYNDKDMPIKPEILKNVSITKTQLIKQADVVMLLYLLGDRFDLDTLKVNYDYYEKRTMHGSSLSPSIYAIMGLRIGKTNMAYRYLKRAAFLDLDDLQHNTREGIHAANTGGVWQTVVFGFAGVSIDINNNLCINPKMPKQWENLKFKLNYKGSKINISISNNNQVRINLLSGNSFDCIINGTREKIQ